jgi:dTDP-glucose 4,6-dehydratase
LPIYGSGKAVRDYLFVEDHCSAIDLAIHNGEVGETYCVGGAAQRNGIEVAEAILNALGKPKELMQFVEDRPGHDMRYDIDPAISSKSLGGNKAYRLKKELLKP